MRIGIDTLVATPVRLGPARKVHHRQLGAHEGRHLPISAWVGREGVGNLRGR